MTADYDASLRDEHYTGHESDVDALLYAQAAHLTWAMDRLSPAQEMRLGTVQDAQEVTA